MILCLLLKRASFATLFPKYRESIFVNRCLRLSKPRTSWNPMLKLNTDWGSMSVATTRKTWDLFIEGKGFDQAFARSVPFQQASRLWRTECTVLFIIKIESRNRERFVKRRQRLWSEWVHKKLNYSHSATMIQGTPYQQWVISKGLKQVRRISEDCMKNVHPIYAIKTL